MRGSILILVTLTAGACSPVNANAGQAIPEPGVTLSETAEEAPERIDGPASPAERAPGVKGDSAVWQDALAADGERIVVSREERWIWLMRGDSVLFDAPVAVGRDTIFRYGGRSWDFNTPTGQMVVLDKETDPLWVPPNWHYYEIAVERGLEPFYLKPDQTVELSDSTTIELKGKEVGRRNRFGNWHPFTPGSEIIFDDRIFVPPIGSPQRQIPKILGTHRLILRDGYLIHGTPEVESIGEWASHGCIRLRNRDVETLYGQVDAGVPVYIY